MVSDREEAARGAVWGAVSGFNEDALQELYKNLRKNRKAKILTNVK